VSAAHTVDQEGRYDGLTLREALPSVVSEIVNAVDPVEVIVFGSVARGEETADSDLDLLVVLDSVDPSERRAVMRQVRGAIHTFVPVDIVIADVAEVESDRDEVGSAVYWPLREGETVHRRMARRVT
jgi:predicted nucleotidyltransferase